MGLRQDLLLPPVDALPAGAAPSSSEEKLRPRLRPGASEEASALMEPPILQIDEGEAATHPGLEGCCTLSAESSREGSRRG